MVTLADYTGREQAYVKHTFLEQYLESLFFKTASAFNHIVYVDGFAGPWQSANEQFEDTSFGIALNALRRAKETWKRSGRVVNMTALLVERDPAAYARLETIPPHYPDLTIRTYNADFLNIVPTILAHIPREAFAFFLIDPKGWRIPLSQLQPLLARRNSEILFNFMFEFINRAASIDDPAVINGLEELMPHGNWKQSLENSEKKLGRALTLDERKEILASAFAQSLRQLGGYKYVCDIPVLRPLSDRPLYLLFHATRHERGLSVVRDCQMVALTAQSKIRAEGKIKHVAASSGQSELFTSLHNMGPDKTAEYLKAQLQAAEETVVELAPQPPATMSYDELWPKVLSLHAVRLTDVNTICGSLRKRGMLVFPNWEVRARVPKGHYTLHKPG
jgi:three-Cys-motif partner protein